MSSCREAARDTREARTIPARDSALFHGAMLEVARRDAEVARLRAEVARLRDALQKAKA